jgi:signal transduction histidine kinase/ligand-binding sensor domain-containing protein/DNA-binding response OmpR family regulator
MLPQPGRPAAVLLVALASLLPRCLSAQEERFAFRHVTIADGLSQNAVHAITQDHRGFMWFGTKDGLDRYDGYDFLVFRHDPFDSTTISDSEITALHEDRQHRLWVGTRSGGLNRFDRDRETFARPPGGPRLRITSIAEDGDGRLWIGTDGEGLFHLTPDGGGAGRDVFERFAHDPSDPSSLASDRVHAVLVDRRGTLWAGTDSGLSRRDPGAEGFVRYRVDPGAPDGLIDRAITALHEDAQRRLWMGSTPGISVFDAERRRISHHYHRYRTFRYGWGEPHALLVDREGAVWLSTRSELMRFDPATETFRSLRHDPLEREGINSDLPTALFQDRSDVLWIGTNGFGLNVHDPKADRFRTFRRPDDRAHRVQGFSVYTIFEDSTGDLWIDAGLLYRWDRDTGELTSFETSSDRPLDFGNTGVWAIVEDPPGFLWAATYEGLFRYEVATGAHRLHRHDPTNPDGLPEQDVKDVFKDREGRIWAVTENHLAELVDSARGVFHSQRITESPTSGEWTFPSTTQDARGALWLASNQGLIRFDPASRTLRRFRNDPSDPTSLSHDVLRSLLLDPREPERYLWIGTAGGGLNRFDFTEETFLHVTTRDGLPNDVVYGVLADDQGRLWLSTNKGIARYDPSSGLVRGYDARDGLQSDEFNSGAAFQSASGELFFGGIYGLSYFRPDEIEDNPHAPEVVITGFRRGNRRETVRDSGTVLPRSVSEAGSVRLSHRDAVITLEFAALDYSAPAKNRYAYRMVGYNDAWIESGPVRAATYTNLPPGRYTFEARGTNNDGLWSERVASLALVVTPPWWRSGWAYALYATLVLGALYGVRRYEMRRVVLEGRLALEHLEGEKLREVDRARSRFFADVSHEFRTPLTLTLGPLDDLQSGLHGPLPPAMAEQVALARRNAARVLDLINQILEVARLEAGGTPLRAQRMDLGEFVRTVARGFMPHAERKVLSLDVSVSGDPVEVYADPGHLDRVISNLLSNALKFTPAGGAVRVSVDADGDHARIAVRDSGPGIAAAELGRVFDRFFRAGRPTEHGEPGTGIGLALAKQLVDLHGGSLTVQSEEGFGSTFTVSLPLGTAHLAPEQRVADDDALPWEARPGTVAAPPEVASGAVGGVASASGSGHASDAAVGHGAEAPGAEAGGLNDEVGPADDVTTVLVVEENPEVRAYVKRHLAPAYRVLEAADGLEGVDMARRSLPDLVLSDVMMPGLDGYELCRALKEDPETDFIPVILLTARAAPEDRLAGLKERADDYLTKPFDPRELLARIGNLIAGRRQLSARFAGHGFSLHPRDVVVEPAEEKLLERVRDAIEAHLGDETFTVERLAHAVHVSRGHLHRRLRELLGESPSDLIRRMRLERAGALLEARVGSVAEVAYSVGFKSVAHFSNRFLDHFGVRPSAYPEERASREPAG